MATQDDLVRDVLGELTVVGGSDTVDPDDSRDVKKKYLAVHRDLSRKFLVDWSEGDAIPDAALEAMTLLVAHRCSRQFGKPTDDGMWREGMMRLWDYRSTPWRPLPEVKVVHY